MRAHLILKDGTLFRGRAPLGFGGGGEAVFTTAMAGYQEILTDPSFAGQMVCMTFPEQGIVGIHADLNEGTRPWATGLLCRRLTFAPDHHRCEGDLPSWLKRHHIPVMTDLDTRALTQHLRDQGSQPSIIWTELDGSLDAGVARAKALPDMTGQALCGAVSCRDRYELNPGGAFRVAVLDGGIKLSILKQLVGAGLHLEVFPWDTPATELTDPRFHGLFLSNGPGDPAALPGMQQEVEACIGQLPIFGICLGHQLLGQAFGGRTFKLKFGHRGANQPVHDLMTGRIEITAQNHGFAVDEASLPKDVEVTHRHLSDGTVEGLRHTRLPIFSLQHHPEASPGPHDAHPAFNRFVALLQDTTMPKRTDLKSVLVLGSGPIQIGQACEFDYSGTQALKALREEGIRTILLNSNPASIMTDPGRADATYIEPLTLSVLAKVIEAEKPDAILPTVGGQTALNLAMEAHASGLLERTGVQLIGAQPEAINRGEDRQLFKALMDDLGLETCRGGFAHNMAEARDLLKLTGFPSIIRPSFTLGGSGGGIAYNVEEFETIIARGLDLSPTKQVLIEESILGWKEFELEVVRDLDDNVEIICSIENFDPMGVHTGDSITVAPALTLTDPEYQAMRDAAIAVIRAVGVETGGSNIQFALEPETSRIIVIEMNPRVSRSSALASKATGFPIAWVATKLALGYRLWELPNAITRMTKAAFEPVLDYVVVKMPRFTFEKFPQADKVLGTQMKSVGEVMSIGRSFQEALQKAVRSLEEGHKGLSGALEGKLDLGRLKEHLIIPGSQRLFWIYHALKAGHSVEELHRLTKITPWFLREIEEIVVLEGRLRSFPVDRLPEELLEKAKRAGFADNQISVFCSGTEAEVAARRATLGLHPAYKRVDTCAGEFLAETPYLYGYWEQTSEAEPTDRPKAIVLGSGPNRIGQGVEFDCCCVQAVEAIRASGVEAILINCNPETVSTDFDTADRLYFEPLTYEHVKAVVDREGKGGKLLGVFAQFGGQTPLKLAGPLHEAGVPLLGTPLSAILDAEDRERFGQALKRLNIPAPMWGMATSFAQALEVAHRVAYPVMVRPSFVLGGRAMAVVFDDAGLEKYMREAVAVSEDQPVLLDRFLDGAQELDIDVVCDGEDVAIAGLLAHIEEAGIHSGDSYAVIPALGVPEEILETVKGYARKLALDLGVRGLMNLQFAVKEGIAYCLEANPRASRTVPFVSKATGVDWAGVAARVGLGQSLKQQGITDGVPRAVSVKGVVFPFAKFPGVDPVLGPEMKSTGEVMGIGETFGEAYAKSLLAAGIPLPLSGTVFLTVNDADKARLPELAQKLVALGFGLCATEGTARTLEAVGLKVRKIFKVNEGRPNAVDLLKNGEVQWVINTPLGRDAFFDESAIRREALRLKIPCLTNLSAALAACEAVETLRGDMTVRAIQSL